MWNLAFIQKSTSLCTQQKVRAMILGGQLNSDPVFQLIPLGKLEYLCE